MSAPPDSLRALVEDAIGEQATYRACGWPHCVSDVWEVTGEHRRWFLKRHTQPHKFVRERRFYEQWRSHVASMAPELVAVFPDTLLIRAVPGEPAETTPLEPNEDRAVFAEAGRFLSALHAVPYTAPQTVSIADELAARMDRWVAQARDTLDASVMRWVTDRFRPSETLVGLERVPTHGDFHARNWMVDRRADGPRLGVFDFEHTRGDAWFFSIVKLWDGPWVGRPDLEVGFWDGYGHALAAEEHEQFVQILLVHALAVIAWSHKHGDAVYEAHGHAVLDRVRRTGAR